jgi:hypothetical protein
LGVIWVKQRQQQQPQTARKEHPPAGRTAAAYSVCPRRRRARLQTLQNGKPQRRAKVRCHSAEAIVDLG